MCPPQSTPGYYGVAAYCADGGVALLDLPGGRIRIGCEKPATRASCEGLLRELSETRMSNFNSFGF